MNYKDRTREFQAMIESAQQSTKGYTEPFLLHNSTARKSPTTATHSHSEFTRRATEINTGIQRLLLRLEKLTKLARTKSVMMDDRSTEVQDLSGIIKIELAKLNTQISELQNYQKIRKATYVVGSNKSSEEHSTQIVVCLQSKLADASASFASVLEARSQDMRAQRERRDQFSATNVVSVPSVSRQRNVRDSPSRDDNVVIEMPGTDSSLQQLAMLTTSAADTTYLESRNVALQGIEAAVNELGSIYQQLATMIAEQGEVVQRIDMNIEDMHVNIERGQSELLKYLRNVGSNRWLMVKIFAILIMFVIFFSVFLI